MLAFSRFGPLVVGALCFALTATSYAADKKDALSRLSKIGVTSTSQDVAVRIDGTKAPDFTSFTMSDPFRVVVDWAGSRIEGAKSEESFDRGLIRGITTKQYDSEAEKISRVTIELAQKTAYRVEADGTNVIVHFVPVATPLPEPIPEPEPEPVAEKKAEPYVPEGPLTEPDVPVPGEAPVVVAKVEPKPAPKPVKVAAKPVPTKPAPAKPAVVATAPKPAKPASRKAAPVDPVAAVIAPDAPAVPEGAPLTEPTFVEEAPKPAKPAPKTTTLAKFVPPAPAPERSAPKRVEPAKVATPTVQAPRAAQPARRAAPPTQQLASRPKLDTGWQPPAVTTRRSLPVVKVAQADTIDAVGTTSADADDMREEAPLPSRSLDGANDFDPGPRVMKYIGFRQMADVSRVFVRVDGKAKFRQVGQGTSFALELINTSVNVKNNERPLDTTYFNSPVTKIQAVRTGDNTRIEVVLRENVPVKVKRIGTTIAIDFTRR